MKLIPCANFNLKSDQKVVVSLYFRVGVGLFRFAQSNGSLLSKYFQSIYRRVFGPYKIRHCYFCLEAKFRNLYLRAWPIANAVSFETKLWLFIYVLTLSLRLFRKEGNARLKHLCSNLIRFPIGFYIAKFYCKVYFINARVNP